jgi:murein L,D-transpeptidase YcbB/YkuD
MLTTVFLRTSLLRTSAALAAITIAVPSAGAQTAAAGTPPATQASPSPSGPTPAETSALPNAGDAPAKPNSDAAPPGASANAVAPSAPAATPAPAATAPATTTAPAAQSEIPAATAAPAAAAAPTTVPAPAVQAATPPALPVVNPVTLATRAWLGTPANTAKVSKDDVAAAIAFYEARTDAPLWVDGSGFTAKAKSAIAEVHKADDWGLSAAAFDIPALTEPSPSTEALAAAEGKLTLELLKYARFAKGGRVNPQSISRINDVTLPIKDPNAVITELVASSSPDAYLRGLHPQHPQFQLLQKALMKARGPAEPEIEIDPALKVLVPSTKATLKKGANAPEVVLLRQRLKVPAEAGAQDAVFDEKLELALKAYQVERGLTASGQLSKATRTALNKEVDANRKPDPARGTQLIVLNMERWRWLPDNIGSTYVWNNIPEYTTRTIKNGEVIFKERIIVGLPQWATPVFSETMKTVVFNPSWGMPDGIKTRELQPRLRAAGGGFLFFGGGGGGPIIRAYGLDVYRGGRKIDPDSVDWSTADVRNYSFIQPSGGKNPLGTVKFLFPNKHDVYMHDTIERSLFEQPNRALSHGCIRVRNPRQFAEIMIAEGNGVSADQAAKIASGGGDVVLKNPIPVHMTYFTAVAGEDGHVSTFSDLYGYDSRLASALTGKALRLEPAIETSSAEQAPAPAASNAKKKKYKAGPDNLADAISGFWMN